MNEPKRREDFYLDADTALIESLPFDMIRIVDTLKKNDEESEKYFLQSKLHFNKFETASKGINADKNKSFINENEQDEQCYNELKKMRDCEQNSLMYCSESIEMLNKHLSSMECYLLRLKKDLDNFKKDELQPHCIPITNPAIKYNFKS